MARSEYTFEEYKEAALPDSESLGILDIEASADAFSPDTLELAVKLVRKHSPALCKEIEERRKSQK